MKKIALLLFLALFGLVSIDVQAQDIDTSKTYLIIKNDGTEYIGKIMSKDAREVLIATENVGQIYIPMHEISEIKEVSETDRNRSGTVIFDDRFATRYFFTTNALPIEKGESYIQWNLWGPDMQFGVADNLSVGLMTSWVAFPIVGTVKYSFPAKDNSKVHFGAGTLLGTYSWTNLNSIIALPFASLTFGDRKANISITGGAFHTSGRLFDSDRFEETRPLLSIGVIKKMGNKATFVFDSVIALRGQDDEFGFSFFMPGIRLQTKPNRAFQLGLTGIRHGAIEGSFGGWVPLPVPYVQWFQTL